MRALSLAWKRFSELDWTARWWTAPAALLALCLLAFGLLIPWLGYYQDDWYQIWFGRAFGPRVFPAYYARERPFIAWLYMLTTPLIGYAPLGWHVFALLARWLAGLVAWSLARRLLPGRTFWAFWLAALFLVYPGFRQQYAAVIYSHYFLQLALQLFSLELMFRAARPGAGSPLRRVILGLAAWAAAGAGLFTSEYFFGLELARPLVLWAALAGEPGAWRQRLRRALLWWLPYLGLLLGFLFWRVFVFQFPTYQPVYTQLAEPGLLPLVRYMLTTIARDVAELGLYAWLLPVRQLTSQALGHLSTAAALGLTAVSAAALWWYSRRAPGLAEPAPAPEVRRPAGERRLGVGLALAGLLLLLGAGWPFWFVNLPVDTQLDGGSRFAISFMPGASLLWCGLVALLIPSRRWAAALLALTAGLAVGHHFLDAEFYRDVQRDEARFFQQLAWRAPGLEPGTLLVTNTFSVVRLLGDNSLTAALNWIYDSQPPYALDYLLYYLPERLDSGHLPGLVPGLPVEKEFRTTRFRSSTDHILLVYYEPPHCLRVLDPALDAALPRPVRMPAEMRDAIPLSNLGQVVALADPPARLPPELFPGRPQDTDWCYDYEKADLARQMGDWQVVAALGDQALEAGAAARRTAELLPFIEGYARAGQVDKATDLTRQVWQARPDGRAATQRALCVTWQRLSGELAHPSSEMLRELGCPPP